MIHVKIDVLAKLRSGTHVGGGGDRRVASGPIHQGRRRGRFRIERNSGPGNRLQVPLLRIRAALCRRHRQEPGRRLQRHREMGALALRGHYHTDLAHHRGRYCPLHGFPPQLHLWREPAASADGSAAVRCVRAASGRRQIPDTRRRCEGDSSRAGGIHARGCGRRTQEGRSLFIQSGIPASARRYRYLDLRPGPRGLDALGGGHSCVELSLDPRKGQGNAFPDQCQRRTTGFPHRIRGYGPAGVCLPNARSVRDVRRQPGVQPAGYRLLNSARRSLQQHTGPVDQAGCSGCHRHNHDLDIAHGDRRVPASN